MAEDYERENEQAPFNMAVDTLRRLGDNLRRIEFISAETSIPKEERQEIKISLVKYFFIQSTPLLGEKVTKQYKDKIIKLKPKMQKIAEKKEYAPTNFIGWDVLYDPELEIKLDNLLVDLQCELQTKGHFMPVEEEGGYD